MHTKPTIETTHNDKSVSWLTDWVMKTKKCLTQTRNNGWQIEINCYRTQGYLSNCELTQVSNWSENIQTNVENMHQHKQWIVTVMYVIQRMIQKCPLQTHTQIHTFPFFCRSYNSVQCCMYIHFVLCSFVCYQCALLIPRCCMYSLNYSNFILFATTHNQTQIQLSPLWDF